MTCTTLFIVHVMLESNSIVIEEIRTVMYGLLFFINFISITSILQYGKREIINLTSAPKTKHTLMEIIESFTKHIFDLIFVPTLTLLMIFSAYIQLVPEPSMITIGTIGFTILTITQIAPLRLQKDRYAREAHFRISDSVKTITISRNMIEGIDRRTRKYKEYIDHIMHAEEVIRCDSDFLMLSGGKFVLMISGIRFLTPVLGTVGPAIAQLVMP